MIEQTGWTTTVNDRGQTEWLPPPDLDTGPRRDARRVNGYHHPERHLLPEDDHGP